MSEQFIISNSRIKLPNKDSIYPGYEWRFSPTSLDLYDSCPYAWYLVYVLNIPMPQQMTPALALGNKIHNVLKEFLKLSKTQQVDRKLLVQLWDKKRSKKGRYNKFNMKGDMALDYWWQWYQGIISDGWVLKEAEEEFCYQILGKNIFGYIDAVFQNLEKYLVVDWKTGLIWKKDSEKNSIQMFLYGNLISKIYDVDPSQVEMALFHVTYNTILKLKLPESEAGERAIKCLDGIAAKNFTKDRTQCGNCRIEMWCDR